MRKNKSKLMAFSLLALCLACLGFGAYALKNATLTVTGTVGFTAHDCLVNVVAEIEGDGVVDGVPNSHGAPSEKRDLIINKTENSNEMIVGGATADDWNKEAEIAETIWFTDLTEDGSVSEIVMTFTLTNQSAYSITASLSNAEIANVRVGASEEITLTAGAQGELTATFNLDLQENGEYPEVNSLPFEVKLDFKKETDGNQGGDNVGDNEGGEVDTEEEITIEAPTNVFLNTDTKVINFTEVENATGYEVAYFNGEDLISYCEIASSGSVLKNTPAQEGDFIVKIRSFITNNNNTIYSNYVEADKFISITGCSHLAFEQNSDTYIVSGIGQCTDDTIIIPTVYNNKPVVGIKTQAFTNKKTFSTIVIPESIKNIETYAFYNCKNLKNVYINSEINSIESDVFYGCSQLKNVYIPNIEVLLNIEFSNNYSNPLSYGSNLYINNELVTNLILPENITSINKYTFNGCNSLENITIPNTVQNIGVNAFESCKSLKAVNIPEGITIINNFTFNNCTSLEEVKLPSTLETINTKAFYNCGMKNIDLPDSLKSITDAFMYCTKLESIIIPDQITELINTFEGCTSLKDVTLSKNLTNLNRVFKNCTSLESIIIPEGVTKMIGANFYGCTALKDIKLPSTLKRIDSSYGSGHFFNCISLVNIEIPSSVVEIGRCVFQNCTNLESIIIPEGVECIYDDTFDFCNNLKWVLVPESISMIENGAFLYANENLKIFYYGTKSDFENYVTDFDYNKIVLSNITNGTIYYYSSTQKSGNYWHYVTDETTGKQVPTVW